MMQRLRPGVLDDLGLVEALKDAIAAWQERNPNTHCRFNVSGDLENLGERINITVYRIVQECLTNISKHAQADNITIALTKAADGLLLAIQDDGKGVDLSIPRSGLGLVGMRERVESLGGEFSLDSREGDGLSIMISVPLSGDEVQV